MLQRFAEETRRERRQAKMHVVNRTMHANVLKTAGNRFLVIDASLLGRYTTQHSGQFAPKVTLLLLRDKAQV